MSIENAIDSDGPVEAAALGAGAYAVAYAVAAALSALGVPAPRSNVLGPVALVAAGWVLVARVGVDVEDSRAAAAAGLALAVGFGVPLLAVARVVATPVGRELATPLVLASDVGAAVVWPLVFGGAGALLADLDADYDLSGVAREAVGTALEWSLPAGAGAYLLAYAVAWLARSVLGVATGLGLLGPAALVLAGWVVADRNRVRWRGAESVVAAAAVGLALVPGFAVLAVGAARVAGTPEATAIAALPVLPDPVVAAVAWPVAAGAAGALLAVLHDEHDLRATGTDAVLSAPAWSLPAGVVAYLVAHAAAHVLANGLGVATGLNLLAPAALALSGWAVADRNGHRWRGPGSALASVAVGLVLLAGFAGTWFAAGTLLADVLPTVVDPAVVAAVVRPLVLSTPLVAVLAWPLAFGAAGAALSALDAAYGFEATGTGAVLDAPAWSLLAGAGAYAAAYAVAWVLASVLGVAAGSNLLAPGALLLAGWVVADRNDHRWHGAGTAIAAATVGLVVLPGFFAAALVGTRVLAAPVAAALATPLVLGNDVAVAVAWPLAFGTAGAALYAYREEYGLYGTAMDAVGTAPQWSLPAGAAAYLGALAVGTVLASVLGVGTGLSLLAPAALLLAGWVVAGRNGLRYAGAESVVAAAAVGLALLPGFAGLAVAALRLAGGAALPLVDVSVASPVPAALLDPLVLSSPLAAAVAWPLTFGAAGAAGHVLDDEYAYANRETAVAFVRRAPWPGAVLGAVTFLAGYHALVFATSVVLVPFGLLGFLPVDLGVPPAEKLAGWLYYSVHGAGVHAPTGVDASFGITTETVGVGDLSVEVPDGFDASADVREGTVYLFGRGPASLLRLLPGVPMAVAGAAAAAVGRLVGERSVRTSLVNGAALAIGYAPLFVLHAARLDHRIAVVFEGGAVGLGLFGVGDVQLASFPIYVVQDGWFYASAVALPVVFGILGALWWSGTLWWFRTVGRL